MEIVKHFTAQWKKIVTIQMKLRRGVGVGEAILPFERKAKVFCKNRILEESSSKWKFRRRFFYW
ncbi:MAG: hypothetical protein ACR2IA_06615 [Pyrinomonadaceae bacterium]